MSLMEHVYIKCNCIFSHCETSHIISGILRPNSQIHTRPLATVNNHLIIYRCNKVCWWPGNLGHQGITMCEVVNNKQPHTIHVALQCKGPISPTSFPHSNSNLMENSLIPDFQITTKFCTWHDSTVVMPYAKFCSAFCIDFWVRAKWNFHRIFVVNEVEVWAIGHHLPVLPVGCHLVCTISNFNTC